MLTAKRPSARGSASPSAANPHVPKALDDVTLRAVAPNPERRYATAAALVRQLRAIDSLLDTHGSGDDEDFAHPAPRTVNAVVIVGALLAALAALAWWFIRE